MEEAQPGATTHPAAVARFVEQLAALGLPAEEVFAAAGLGAVHLRGEARVRRAAFLRAKAEAARRLDDPCLGFRLGASTQLEGFDVYGAAIAHASTLEEAFDVARRFLAVWEEGTVVEMERVGERMRVTYACAVGDALATAIDCQQSVVFLAGTIVALTRGRVQVTVGCACAPPRHPECLAAARAPGHTLRFDEAAWYLELPRSALQLDLRGAHPAVAPLLHAHLEREMESLREPTDLRARLRAALMRGLKRGWSVRDVAAVLGVSVRTLQARLSQEGTSYASEVAAVRLALAKELLGDERLSIEQIADRVGFDSMPGFSRFFRRLTGMAPSDYRARHRG